eukprot:1186886-Amphidinium_carterae.1
MPIPLAHMPRERQYYHPLGLTCMYARPQKRWPDRQIAQLDEVHSTKELRLRNNEDEQEKDRMESIMDNILVQPWWQYEDEVTNAEQLSKVVGTRWVINDRRVINDRPSNSGGREVKC